MITKLAKLVKKQRYTRKAWRAGILKPSDDDLNRFHTKYGKNPGVHLGKHKDGYYVATRTRSKLYEQPDEFPASVIQSVARHG